VPNRHIIGSTVEMIGIGLNFNISMVLASYNFNDISFTIIASILAELCAVEGT